jgi:hypothetical protein
VQVLREIARMQWHLPAPGTNAPRARKLLTFHSRTPVQELQNAAGLHGQARCREACAGIQQRVRARIAAGPASEREKARAEVCTTESSIINAAQAVLLVPELLYLHDRMTSYLSAAPQPGGMSEAEAQNILLMCSVIFSKDVQLTFRYPWDPEDGPDKTHQVCSPHTSDPNQPWHG